MRVHDEEPRTAALVLARREAPAAKPLQMGSNGPAVIVLQVRLNRLDEVDVPLEADGIFGRMTARALRQFKAAHGVGDRRAQGSSDDR